MIYPAEYEALCKTDPERLRQVELSAVQRGRLERFLALPPDSLCAKVAGAAFLAGKR